MLGGPSGSGKSTYAKKQIANVDMVISSDDFNRKNKDSYSHRLYYIKKMNIVEDMIGVYMRMRNTEFLTILLTWALTNKFEVILDRTNLDLESRKKFIDIAKEHDIPVSMYWIRTPSRILYDRVSHYRNHAILKTGKVARNALKHQLMELIIPHKNEGFSNVTIFDGRRPLPPLSFA